jgi:hypothetical protein
MKCHSLRDAIVELARKGEAGPGTVAAVESHLEHCRACQTLMARERQLSRGLKALAEVTAAQAPSEAVGRRLLEAFAERQSTVHPFVAGGSGRTRRRWLGSWVRMAAAVALIAGVAAWWWSGRNHPEVAPQPSLVTGARAVVRETAPVPAIAPAGARGSGRSERLKDHGSRRSRPRGVPRPSLVQPAGFVAVPGAAGLPDFESGQIIRLEIPLTSLPTYGIDILPDAQGAPVEADLLVGQDGQARAIRLVTSDSR